MRLMRINIAVLPMLLAACGGGGGGGAGGTPPPDTAATRILTGASAPVETPGTQDARARVILARADSLIVSTIFAETNSPRLPSFRIQTSCSGTRCTWREPSTRVSGTINLSDLQLLQGRASAVITKHGITTIQESAAGVGSYYSWMDHAAFAVQTERDSASGIRFDVHYGLAGGDLAGTRPSSIRGTWRGLMVGAPRSGTFRGNRLQGDAVLTYLGGGVSTLDAAFTNIRDLDRGASYSTTSVRFGDIPVRADGTYRRGVTGNRIQGGFYGPGHVEAAGIFEQADIVGAFGAKRQ